MPGDLRPRGIGDFGISEVGDATIAVDGDDYTWDWHAVQSESGNLGAAQVFGTMTDGNVAGVHYDVRTGPERLSFEVSARLYAFERQLALLQQRVATLEAELDQWRGD